MRVILLNMSYIISLLKAHQWLFISFREKFRPFECLQGSEPSHLLYPPVLSSASPCSAPFFLSHVNIHTDFRASPQTPQIHSDLRAFLLSELLYLF